MGAASLVSQVRPVLKAREATNMVAPRISGLLPAGSATALGGSVGSGFYGLLGR